MIVHNCGYGGGPGAIERMAAPLHIDLAAIGVDPQTIVDAYRDLHRPVPIFWHDLETAFRTVLVSRRTTRQIVGKLAIEKHPDRVRIVLPSGRAMTYMNARLEERHPGSRGFGKDEIAYDNAVNGRVRVRRTFGGRLAQNVIEGFCRDLLADAMLRVDAMGWDIAFDVHDEIVGETSIECGEEYRAVMQEIMRTPPAWAEGMPVHSTPELMARYGK
jgi:DNA polymerase